MRSNTVIKSKNVFDKFYTNDNAVKRCIEELKQFLNPEDFLLIEPSAGAGAFIKPLWPNIIGFDIAPDHPNVNKQDFLALTSADIYRINPNNKHIVFIGNPPFGRCASLAIKFFNKCASFDETEFIAFIVPPTFNKLSVQSKLDKFFSLAHTVQLDKNSFNLNGKPYDVPAIFQIWKRCNIARESIDNLDIIKNNVWFDIVKPNEADLAIRRAGGQAGKVLDGLDYKRCSTYFIRSKHPLLEQYLRKSEDYFRKMASNTVGARSISLVEIILHLNSINGEEEI